MIVTLIYKICLFFIFPVIFFYVLIKSIKTKDLTLIYNKFGFFNFLNLKNSNEYCIHCASLGEINGASSLIKNIKKKNNIFISTNTISGKNRAKELFPELDVVYFPLDYKIIVTQWLKNYINLKNILIYETEIWPNFYSECRKKNITICIINARISNSVLKNFYLRKLYKKTLGCCSFILCKSEYEMKKYLSLDIKKNILYNLGNLKYSFNTEINEYQSKTKKKIYFLMASTHFPDEVLHIESIKYLINKKIPVVIAPRHIKRVGEIKKIFNKENLKTEFYSNFLKGNKHKYVKDGILIIDTFGDLESFYEEAKFVYVGGGFSKRGVQNILEPARFAKPIIIGPNIDNFYEEISGCREIVIIKAQAKFLIISNILEEIKFFIENPGIIEERGIKIKNQIKNFSGSLENYLNFLIEKKVIS